tara:strand:- start:1260 stop:1955 length:696 start_codon:yes stop_codon:yes gene_type:complete
MKKIYKIFLIILVFIFLSTFNPQEIGPYSKNKSNFFKIKKIEILNNNLVNKNKILKKISHLYKKNIFYIEKSKIIEPLKEIDFLEKIEVKKVYPNTIVLIVYETKPLAILFKENKKYFIDNLSNLINFEEKTFSNYLPNIIGEGAESHFINFYKNLNDNKFPINEIKNYYYFPVGRWDIKLTNDKLIKFPINKINKAIIQSIELFERKDLESYNIIDLRIHDKIIVEKKDD